MSSEGRRARSLLLSLKRAAADLTPADRGRLDRIANRLRRALGNATSDPPGRPPNRRAS